MEAFGSYRIVRELSRKPYGTIYIALKEGEAGEYLIKVFNPLGSPEDEVADDPPVLSFLESAALQMKITQSHAKNWAPVADLGICPEGGYYVSRFYSSSARRLTDVHFHFQSNTLKAVVQGIVNGLKEIQAIANRPHGELYLTSILIDRNRINDPEGTVLAEPAPADVAAQTGYLGDLSNLGKVLYQLITHKPHSQTSTLWPIQISDQWNVLRATKEQWLDLVNWLLDPQATEQTHTLAALENKLRQIRQKRSKTPLKIAVAASLILAAGAGGMGMWYFSLRGQWRHFTKLIQDASLAQASNFYANYLAREDLRTGLANPQLAELPEIQVLRTTLEKLSAKNAALDLKAFESDSRVTVDTAPFEILRSDRWKGAEADLIALRQAIDGWKVPQELMDRAWQFGEWPELRRQIEQIARAGGIKRDKPDPDAMISALEWKNAMGDFEWSVALRKIRSAKQSFEHLDDPLLDQYAAVADSVLIAGAKVTTPQELKDLKDRLSQTSELASDLEKAVADPKIHDRIVMDLKPTEFYKSAMADISASADPIGSRIKALKEWPRKVLEVPIPDEKKNPLDGLLGKMKRAKGEMNLAKDDASDDDLAIMNRRIESATQLIAKLESPDLPANEQIALSEQADGLLEPTIAMSREIQDAAKTKRALLLSIAEKFNSLNSAIEKRIKEVEAFDAGKAKGVSDLLGELRKKTDAFGTDYRKKRESEIESDSAELLKSLKDLLAKA